MQDKAYQINKSITLIKILTLFRFIVILIHYYFKIVLFKSIFFIKQHIPQTTQRILKYKVYQYPKIMLLLKRFRSRLKHYKNTHMIHPLDYLALTLINLLFIPLFTRLIKKSEWKVRLREQLEQELNIEFSSSIAVHTPLNAKKDSLKTWLSINKTDTLPTTQQYLYADLSKAIRFFHSHE